MPEAGWRSAGPDWRALYERERERAEAAGARAEELRRAEARARCDAGYWKSRWGASRRRLGEVVAATREARRAARDALALQREVERLRGLLREAGVCAGKRSTVMALRMKVERLRRKGRAQEKALDARGAGVRTLRRRIKHLEGRLAELRESRTVLPKGKAGGGSGRARSGRGAGSPGRRPMVARRGRCSRNAPRNTTRRRMRGCAGTAGARTRPTAPRSPRSPRSRSGRTGG